jgi:hypothetical protein
LLKLKTEPIDFGSMSFINGFDRLRSQLRNLIEPNEEPKEKDVLRWSERDVQNWAGNRRFHVGIAANLDSCDGRILKEIYSMKQEAPFVLFETMKSRSSNDQQSFDFNFNDFIFFTKELNRLFESN